MTNPTHEHPHPGGRTRPDRDDVLGRGTPLGCWRVSVHRLPHSLRGEVYRLGNNLLRIEHRPDAARFETHVVAMSALAHMVQLDPVALRAEVEAEQIVVGDIRWEEPK